MKFDYSLDYSKLDLRKNPELYRIGKGEQGVLLVEPYKSEILPHWRFKTPEIARESAQKIYRMFLDYKTENDFIGMDMARKYLQMGFTRARRYANHASGRKYDPETQQVLPQEKDHADNPKAKSAEIFKTYYDLARQDEDYLKMKAEFKEKYYT